jgi:ADP-ribose pyrophosphatase YjhB (NUDIX family)
VSCESQEKKKKSTVLREVKKKTGVSIAIRRTPLHYSNKTNLQFEVHYNMHSATCSVKSQHIPSDDSVAHARNFLNYMTYEYDI